MSEINDTYVADGDDIRGAVGLMSQ